MFIDTITYATKEAEVKCIDLQPNVGDKFVKVYDAPLVRDSISRVMKDSEIQKNITKNFKTKISEKITHRNFSCFIEEMPLSSFVNFQYQNSYENILIRNEISTLHQISLVDKLKEKYSSPLQIKSFIKDLLTQSTVFAKFNPVQIAGDRSMNNDIIIIMPQDAQANNAFNDLLRDAIINGNPGRPIPAGNIIYGDSLTEMTIINIKNLFQLRHLDIVQFLKTKYHQALNDPNEALRKRAKITLHTEGDDKTFLDLFQELPNYDDFFPFIILAKHFGVVKKLKDPLTEIENYYIVPEDILLNEQVSIGKFLYQDFYNLPYIEIKNLENRVSLKLKAEYLAISSKEKLINDLAILATEYLNERGGNPMDIEFKKYREANLKLIEIINK
jgi:hypothetical protein